MGSGAEWAAGLVASAAESATEVSVVAALAPVVELAVALGLRAAVVLGMQAAGLAGGRP